MASIILEPKKIEKEIRNQTQKVKSFILNSAFQTLELIYSQNFGMARPKNSFMFLNKGQLFIEVNKKICVVLCTLLSFFFFLVLINNIEWK